MKDVGRMATLPAPDRRGCVMQLKDYTEFERRIGVTWNDKGLLTQAFDRSWIERITAVVRDRLKVLGDIEEEHTFFFEDPPSYQAEAVEKFLRADGMAPRLQALKDRLSRLPSFETAAVEQTMREMVAEQQLDSKDLIHPARVAVTGRAVSPPLFEVMSILGKEKVLSRLEHAATNLAKK